MFCCPSLCVFFNLSFNLTVPTFSKPIPACIAMFVCRDCSYANMYFRSLYVSESLHQLYGLFRFLVPRCLICALALYLHVFKAELHDAAHSKMSLIKINMMWCDTRQWVWPGFMHTLCWDLCDAILWSIFGLLQIFPHSCSETRFLVLLALKVHVCHRSWTLDCAEVLSLKRQRG